MLTVLTCLAYEHDYLSLGVALAVCSVGCVVTMRLFARTRRTSGVRRAHWLFLCGVTSGCTIWTTHFVAMLGFQLPVAQAYEPVNTLLSLFLAIALSTLGLVIASSTKNSSLIELGGAILGAGIAAMHYLGMKAFLVAGEIAWDYTLVAWSILLGCAFGALAFNRVSRPVTRYCNYGGAASLALAICAMHFTGMGAITIVPNPLIEVPEALMSDTLMTFSVVGVMALILGTGLSTYVIDASQRTEAAERYNRLASYDAVTGMPNRAHLATRLEQILTDTLDETDKVAVFVIELAGLWEINNVHGQSAGDQVLMAVAEHLSEALDETEFVARSRGDELIAVKHRISGNGQVEEFTDKLRSRIAEPIPIGEKYLSVDMLCGIALFPDDATNQQELLSRADLARHRAKHSPTQLICRYDRSMDETNRTRSALAIDLRNAIDRDELELHYQPQTNVASGELVGFEVLLRWTHKERGAISPGQFIPIAEETGLILPIGEWVLKTACRAAAKWKNPYKIAVNVAPLQFSDGNLPKLVLDTLVETGLPASRLELETTESSIFEDHQRTLHIVRQLKSLGVRIAMDDYGTGYSSLSMLQTFPFDKIKIDRSFVSGVTTNQQAAAIVKATMILAEGLGLGVLAEGVESQDDLDYLKSVRCHEAQGYFVGRPAPLKDILHLVNGDPESTRAGSQQEIAAKISASLQLSA